MENKFKRGLLDLVHEDLSAFTPGLKISAFHRGKRKIDLALGDTYLYYDLASLTKIMFAATATMKLVDQKRLRVSDPVRKFLPWWKHNTRIEQLLTHSAGLAWWRPFYEKIDLKLSMLARREQLRKSLASAKLHRTTKAVYSDLDILLLGFVLEELFEKPLLEIWQKQLRPQLKMRETYFHPNNKPHFARSQYAPTESCPWRHKTLRGEVHDDNTWAFGGVSSHAGLFGPMTDVEKFGLELRRGILSKTGSRIASHATLKLFTKRAIPRQRGDWALGFMMPTHGAASCGRYFSLNSVGHTGFTGTSLWFDPHHDLLVIILSNRVHPTRDNKAFVKLRPQIHDLIFKTLDL